MAEMTQGTVARCPAVLVTAPASGQGKTTITAALARLHARQGRRVRVFKCGPDFLDPFWHELASGTPVSQIALWMTGEAVCRARLHAAAQEADLIIVEGVMGLYDGEPSAADLALRFGLPVLAVIDAGAMAGTFGAVAYGLQHYRAGLRQGQLRLSDFPRTVLGVPPFLLKQFLSHSLTTLKLFLTGKPRLLRQSMNTSHALGLIVGYRRRS